MSLSRGFLPEAAMPENKGAFFPGGEVAGTGWSGVELPLASLTGRLEL